MKKLSYKKITAFSPCYDPIKFISKNWTGTAVSILKKTEIPAQDRLWVVVRKEFMTEEQLLRFGLACARQCEHLNSDPRVKACNDATERYIKGKITAEKLEKFSSAARSAARSATRSATRSAADYAALSAALSSTYSAAYSAADSAAYSAARSAARSAALSSTYSAALSSTYSAAREEQCKFLIKILSRKGSK